MAEDATEFPFIKFKVEAKEKIRLASFWWGGCIALGTWGRHMAPDVNPGSRKVVIWLKKRFTLSEPFVSFKVFSVCSLASVFIVTRQLGGLTWQALGTCLCFPPQVSCIAGGFSTIWATTEGPRRVHLPSWSFLFFLILFIYLDCAGSSCCTGFSLGAARGPTL